MSWPTCYYCKSPIRYEPLEAALDGGVKGYFHRSHLREYQAKQRRKGKLRGERRQ